MSGAAFYISIALLLVAADAKKNVLFLVADDMRPEINSYFGTDYPSRLFPSIHTPNLDNLAKNCTVFRKAYVQQAVCSPSRSSFLTGRRPDTTHVYDSISHFRTTGGDFTTIPQYFKNKGYRSFGMGKIFHPGGKSGSDDPVSWSEEYYHADTQWSTNKRRLASSWLAVKPGKEKKEPLEDTLYTKRTLEVLDSVASKAKSGEEPFFLAVGFVKPHLPFIFPEKYLDYYPESDLKSPSNPYVPTGLPEVAWFNYNELRGYRDIEKLGVTGDFNTTLPDYVTKNLRRAYAATVTYIDDQIGQVLEKLETTGLADNTVVVFLGDHGFQLGEHAEWCKQTNFELATRAPLMIKVPGVTDGPNVREELVEFVDIFPTLIEAAGYESMVLCPEDSSATSLCTEGTSLMPLIRKETIQWKDAAFSQFIRGNYMGYSIRTTRYRYTEWAKFDGEPNYQTDWSKLDGIELYDHDIDSEENYNYASNVRYIDVAQELSDKLRDGWRKAIPASSSSSKRSMDILIAKLLRELDLDI